MYNSYATHQTTEASEPKHLGRVFVIVSLLLVIISLVISIIVVAVNRSATTGNSTDINTGISIMVAPLSAKITVDNAIYGNGTYQIKAGKHRAKISADGFQPIDLEFEVKTNKITPITAYLKPSSGSSYSVEDYDLLRFISNDQETDRMVEDAILELGLQYQFPSTVNGIFRNAILPLDNTYTDYSKQIVKLAMSAYFYFAHPDITSYQSLSFDGQGNSIVVIFDNSAKYTIPILYTTNEDSKDAIKMVYDILIEKSDTQDVIFQYDGRFSYEEFSEAIDVDTENFK